MKKRHILSAMCVGVLNCFSSIGYAQDSLYAYPKDEKKAPIDLKPGEPLIKIPLEDNGILEIDISFDNSKRSEMSLYEVENDEDRSIAVRAEIRLPF